LILGAVFVAALAGACWLDASLRPFGAILASLAVLITPLAAGEMLRLYRERGVAPSPASVYAGTLLPVALSGVPIFIPAVQRGPVLGNAGWLAIGLALGLMAAFAGEMRRYETPGKSIANVAHAALAVLYIGGLVGMLVQLRLVSHAGGVGGWRGLIPLLATIATVKLSDIGQYAVGRTWGRHKLAPRISPGKTWEGAIGGIMLATVVAGLVMAALGQGPHRWRAASLLMDWGFAFSVAIAGLVGDLAESLLKRDAGVKDSSDWMPGFGGVLDLLDSILFAAPVGYLWFVFGLGGP
jgi:phosphatidate cytidylyltransferase